MSGKGRGHASRIQTIVELLLPDHDLILLASGDAYQQLSERYKAHPQVDVHSLSGLLLGCHNEKVDYTRSSGGTVSYLFILRCVITQIERIIRERRPSLAITDSEPMLPRAAAKYKVPCVSFDHQHSLSFCDLRSLPWQYRWRALFLRLSILLNYRGQMGEAVSAFHHLPLRRRAKHVRQLGVLLRASVVAAKEISHVRNHVLVYVRGQAPKNLLQSLEKCGRRCIVYGMGQRPAYQNIEFQNFSEDRFVEDLARCDYLISTAGKQLVGEAYYLGKPVLALPEPSNFEQQLNGWLIKQSKCGWTVDFNGLTPHVLHQFVLATPVLRKNLASCRIDGNMQVIKFIEDFLPTKNSNLEASPKSDVELQQQCDFEKY